MDEVTKFPDRRRTPGGQPLSLVWPALSCAGAVLAVGWLGLLWWQPAASWQALLAAFVLALAAILGSAWLFRARARRRLRAAVDAYAEREIARTRVRKTPQRLRTPPPWSARLGNRY
jgi:hypothetical protein